MVSEDIKILVLAGGIGSRLWPLSRFNQPKQFIKLTKLSPFQESLVRALRVTKGENIFISTEKFFLNIIKRQIRHLDGIRFENVLTRPISHLDTAGSIFLTLNQLKKENKLSDDDIISVFPSDHIIDNLDIFEKSIKEAYELIKKEENIVFLGIVPDSISVDYGYIEIDEPLTSSIFRGKKFFEKPNFELAKKFFESGNYLWNSGIFVTKVSFLFKLLKKFAPQIFDNLDFKNSYNFSIDKLLFEKLSDFYVEKCNFRWIDIGSWPLIKKYMSTSLPITKESPIRNYLIGEDINIIDCKDCFVFKKDFKKNISIIGLENIIIVAVENAILIMDPKYNYSLKELINQFEKENRNDILFYKPWVSIVTIVYTYRDVLRDAVKSVLTQTYPYIEYIIVDYGNNQNWSNELREFISNFNLESKEVYIINEKNKWPGIYPAMNRGLKEVTGDIVGILNADDFYEDEHTIEYVVNAMVEHNADICWGNIVYVKKENLEVITRFWRSSNYSKNDYKKGFQIPHPAFFVKRWVYEKFGYYREDIPIAADYEFMLRVLEKHGDEVRCYHLNRVLTRVREGGDSNWRNIFKVIKGAFYSYKAQKVSGVKPSLSSIIKKPLKKIPQIFLR